jgi:hypothetical protein
MVGNLTPARGPVLDSEGTMTATRLGLALFLGLAVTFTLPAQDEGKQFSE